MSEGVLALGDVQRGQGNKVLHGQEQDDRGRRGLALEIRHAVHGTSSELSRSLGPVLAYAHLKGRKR